MSRYQDHAARQILILLRVSDDIDIIGDTNVTVTNPPELLAWTELLEAPTIIGWRSLEAGHRYIHVETFHDAPPIRGTISVSLTGDDHREYWNELFPGDLVNGQELNITIKDLAKAWEKMPLIPPDG